MERKQKRIVIILVVMLVLSVASMFSFYINKFTYNFLQKHFNIISNNQTLLVHFVSVGQGDAFAINLPDGKIAVIDTGPEDSAVTLQNYIQDKVLASKRNKVIDYLILTHADLDHIGGAMQLLNNFKVDTIYMPAFKDSNSFLELQNFVKNSKIQTKFNENGIKIEQNGYCFEFFGPIENFSNSNESCPVIRLEYLNQSFLFTADIDADIEKALIEKFGARLQSDVLKVAHHSSKYSSSMEFVSAVQPKYAVISCGENGYGHPADAAIENLIAFGAQIFRTDTDGNIVFAVNKFYNLSVNTGDLSIIANNFDICNSFLVVHLILSTIVLKIIFTKEKTKHTRKTLEN